MLLCFFSTVVSTCREGKLGVFFSLVAHLIWGQSLVRGVLFLALAVLTFPFRMGISDFLPRSMDVKLGVFPEGVSSLDIVKSLLDFFQENADFKVVAVQQCPNKIARVTFEEGGEAAKADFVDEGSILIRGVKCQVIRPALPGDRVLVYHYPYENDDRQVERALSQFGLVKDVSYQSWVSFKDVHTGTRVVRMDRTTRIPRSIMIDGFRCKIWYRGQPVTCDVCREEGHVAAKCSKKGTCFNCRQPGHMSRDCPDKSYGRGAWGQPAGGVSWVSGPDGAAGGGPPAVESPCIEHVSVDGSSLPVGDVPSCPSVLSGASSSSVEGGAPDCRGSPSAVASCSGNVASVCDSNVLDDNGLLIVKVSNGNSSNVMGSAISNVSGDPPISNVSNIVNAGNVSSADNVSNLDNINASAGTVRTGCPDSGVPLFDLADGVASDSPPSSGDSEMVPASGPRKRPAPESPLEDSSAPPGLALRPVGKEAGISKVSKKNSGGRGHHSLPASVSLAAEMASSRGRPPH